MGKVFVENKEVTIVEKSPKESSEHNMCGKYYMLDTLTRHQFKSTLTRYNKYQKIVISKAMRFGLEYFKVIYSDDKEGKAWNLIELARGMEIRIHRLSDDMFIVVGDAKDVEGVESQVSFCRIKPSTKVEEFAISFCKLNHFYIVQDSIVLSYTNVDEVDNKMKTTIATYNFDGQLLKNHFEGDRQI